PAYWPGRQVVRDLSSTAADARFAHTESGSRAELFASVADALDAATRERPTAIVLEDLHWADASSLAMAQFIVANLPGLKLVVVLTARDEPTERETAVTARPANLPPAGLSLPRTGPATAASAAGGRGVLAARAPA